jgi:NADH:ubiquinone oxidoreductase subunit 2 (subunit N)
VSLISGENYIFGLDFTLLSYFSKQVMISFCGFNQILFLLHARDLTSCSAKNIIVSFFLFIGTYFFLKSKNFFVYALCFQFLNLLLFLPYTSLMNEKRIRSILDYFVLNIFIFCLFILGVSFFIGATNSLNFVNFEVHNQSYFILSISFFIFVTCFKMGVFPFHNWLMPLYSGFDFKNLFSYFFIEKVVIGWSLISLLQNLIMHLTKDYQSTIFWCLTILATMTTIYGNLLAIMQVKIKKIIAYYSISHSGFLLFFSCLSYEQKMNQQFLFYLIFFSFSLTLVYLFLCKGRDGKNIEELDDLQYLFQDSPKYAMGLFICFLFVFSSTLTLGFIFNFQIFINAFREGFIFEVITLIGLNFFGAGYLLSKFLVIFKRRVKLRKRPLLAN